MKKIEVYFKKIGYSETCLAMCLNGVRSEFTLCEKSIDDICEVISNWLKGFAGEKLTFKNLKFTTSNENYNRIQEKTLLNEKSVYELLKEKGINIEIWKL